jgi:hypothetical protein
MSERGSRWNGKSQARGWDACPEGFKGKDILGLPWMCAFALRDDGWFLRTEIIIRQRWICPCGCGHEMELAFEGADNDIIWEKTNPFPEASLDRPSRVHEYLFLLSKKPRYFFDRDAIREPHKDPNESLQRRLRKIGRTHGRGQAAQKPTGTNESLSRWYDARGRLSRSVWSIAVARSGADHPARMPDELAERCIKASTRPGDVVLDPAAGSGTVPRVAASLGRDAIGCDLNPQYVDIMREECGLQPRRREMRPLTDGLFAAAGGAS